MRKMRYRGPGPALILILSLVAVCGCRTPEEPPLPKAVPVEQAAPAPEPGSRKIETSGGAALIPVEVGPLSRLTAAEKKLLYRYYLAALPGDDIYAYQLGAMNLVAKRLFEGILSARRALPEELREKIVPYAHRFLLCGGNRDPWTGEKFLPPFIPGELAAAAEIAIGRGADIGLADFRGPELGANQLDQIAALVSAIGPDLFGRKDRPDPDAGAPETAPGPLAAKIAEIEEQLPGAPGPDAVIGVRDSRVDPWGGKPVFGAIVMVRDPDLTEKIRKLSALGLYFEKELAKVARLKVRPVPWEACQAVVATGWRALDMRVEAVFAAAQRSFYLSNLADATAARLAPRQREAEQAVFLLSRVIGRGTLRADTAERLQRWSAPIAAMQGDLAALYLAFSDRISETGLVADEESAKAIYDSYASLVFEALLDPGTPEREAGRAARIAVVRWIIEKGAAEIRDQDGRLSVRVADYAAMRSAAGELLGRVSRILQEGDLRSARELVEKYGAVPARWRAEARARFDKLGLPRRAVFLYPRLEPRFDDSGEISDLLIQGGRREAE